MWGNFLRWMAMHARTGYRALILTVAWTLLSANGPSAPASADPDHEKQRPQANAGETLPTMDKGLSMEDLIAAARKEHWAFKPVKEPPLPNLGGNLRPDSPIDFFVYAKLEKRGLSPSLPASKETLIRRATYDLTGLPPTLDDVKAFLNDEAPDAFEKLVDRLLASPAYGERWGRYWLDVARYSDTKGYVFEEDRFFPFSHTYRDYVIRAFNDDLPYDEFILEQLAADLLDLTGHREDLAAMGFLTLGRRYLNNVHDITDDRIDVISRGLMGLTVSCARCHEHKFDPIPSEDYYSLYGVFRSSVEPSELPLIEEPDPDDPQYQEYIKELEAKETELRDFRRMLHVNFLAHAREKIGEYLLAAHDVKDMTEDGPLRALAKERELHWQLVQGWRDYLKTKSEDPGPIFAPWAAFSALAEDAFEGEAPAMAKRFSENKDANQLINTRIAQAFKEEPPKTISDVAQRYGKLIETVNKEWLDILAAHTAMAARQENNESPLPAALADAGAEALRQIVYGKDSPANFPETDVDQLGDIPTRNRMTQFRKGIQRHKAIHPGRPNRAMALEDAKKPFDPYVFERGKPSSKGPQVPRQFLAVLSGDDRKPFEHGSGRLELARAIADKDNPLTARVFVNRVWMHHFGKPLVATLSDFGLRSDPPTHPQLLDYLAWRFMEDGWSVKSLHRVIMNSHTYGQSTQENKFAAATDPTNRLLWRQNRQRLDFEAMRDSLLVASGAMDRTMGGQSVKMTDAPYTTRRTVYGLIERQNLPALFRTFDFASPDIHSPRRYETTVPQQALYLMNSPFVLEQARTLAKRPEVTEARTHADRLKELYRILFQREPNSGEIKTGLAFIKKQEKKGPPQLHHEPTWQYGYGKFDVEEGVITSYTPFPHFSKDTYKNSKTMPDPDLAYTSLNARGGHPGTTPDRSTIRRWVAPSDGVISIDGLVKHPQENGDGVIASIVSSRHGLLASHPVHNGEAKTSVDKVAIQKGDTIDFVTANNTGDTYDSYTWTVTINMIETRGEALKTGAPRLLWSSRTDFSGPPPTPPEPLEAWEAYAHTLLMTNEFIFID